MLDIAKQKSPTKTLLGNFRRTPSQGQRVEQSSDLIKDGIYQFTKRVMANPKVAHKIQAASQKDTLNQSQVSLSTSHSF